MPDIAGPQVHPYALGQLDSGEAASLVPGDSREQECLLANDIPRIDATESSLYRCGLHVAGIEELVLERARLVECELATPELTSLAAAEGTWRRVTVTAGRIGALEAAEAHWDGVVVTGTRVGYLSLRGAQVTDTVIEGCQVDTLDLTGGTLDRVRVRDCVVAELVVPRVRLHDVDLRGTDLTSVEGILGLAGAAITANQLLALASALAQACGLRVLPEL